MSTPDTSLPLPLQASAFGLDAAEEPLELVQTHIGLIYLSRSFAFKMKKHVKFDFLDFTSLEQRRWACEREVTLNTRLCPDLYHGLCPVLRDAAGRVRVGRPGQTDAETVDWAVWMRRMPSERMLDRLLMEQRVTRADVEALADVLAPFYLRQRGAIAPGALGDLESVRGNVEENLRNAARHDPAVLAPEAHRLIESRAQHFMKKYGEVIARRAADGFIVDGHGDLRAENICMPLGQRPLLFDCIEFNERFRIIDSALDVAFLAMDLDSRGREDLSAAFLARYRDACDANAPPALLRFYLGYRALIKGNVAAWIAEDTNIPSAQRDASRRQARGLFDLSVRYALQDKPILFVCCGVAGSGKSSLARELSARLRCSHIATDFVRDEIVARGAPLPERYAPSVSQRVYDTLFERAAQALGQRRAIVLDGTFTRREVRQRAAKIARDAGACAILLWADCPAEVLLAHIRQRTQSGDVYGSEATEAVAREQLAGFEAPSPDEFDAVCRIDTSAPIATSREQAWRTAISAIQESF